MYMKKAALLSESRANTDGETTSRIHPIQHLFRRLRFRQVGFQPRALRQLLQQFPGLLWRQLNADDL